MSFQIASSLAPNAPFTTINSLKDLFDPRTHSLWKDSRLTGNEFITLSKILFTRDNVSNWDDFINPLFSITSSVRNSSNTKTFYQEFLHAIPDDLLWTLPFQTLSSYRPTQNQYMLFTCRYDDYSNISHWSFGYRSKETIVSSPTEAASVFIDFATNFSEYAHRNSHKICQDIWAGYHQTFKYLFNFCNNIRLFTSTPPHDSTREYSRNTHFTATQLFNYLSLNPNAILQINPVFDSFHIEIPFNENDRTQFYDLFSYSTDVTRLLPGKKKLDHEGTPVYIGVELELATDYEISDLINASKEVFFIAKSDGSVNGRKANKLELVTRPASFKYLKKQYAMWFNNLDYTKFDCTNETNNGMHVHIDRKSFDDNFHIRNFCWFINNPANTPFIVAMSDRGSIEAMRNYTPFLPFSSNLSRTAAFKSSHKLIEGHRGATNLKGGWANGKTLEVRIFRGIVSYAAIIKNLEFVESLFYFTRSLTSYRELTLAAYIKWLYATPINQYTILKKFIEANDIDKFLLAADVKDIIFNETDPNKIVSLLTKSGLAINNDHISYLNKGRKRTFTLDKDTGKITVIRHDLFKLADLDISLAKRIAGANQAA